MTNTFSGRTVSGNRWVIVIAAVFLQIALGAIYSWSVFLKPLASRYFDVPVKALKAAQTGPTNLTFSITIIAVGVVAGFGGSLQRRYGPRLIATIGGLLYGLGVFLAAFAPNLFALYLTYGVISGIGLGLGYIVPIAMLLKWFPDRRGFITGLAVAGFGGGAAITGPLAAAMIGSKAVGLQSTLLYLGLAYIVITVAAAQFFRQAPDGYAPDGWSASTQQQTLRSRHEYTLNEALRNPNWYVLWLMLTLNVTAGAALISVASPLTQELTGVATLTAAFIVTTNSIFNAAGRFFWSWLSESIGRPYTFLAIFVIQLLALILITLLPTPASFAALIVIEGVIVLCYGGGFGTMPAFTADFFGAKNAGAIYGVMLTAWSIGSVIGPQIITLVKPTSKALYIIAGIMLVSCALPLVARVLARRQSTSDALEVVASND